MGDDRENAQKRRSYRLPNLDKAPTAEQRQPMASLGNRDVNSQSVLKRGPGRPRKKQVASLGNRDVNSQSVLKRGPGRPRKNQDKAATSAGAVKRARSTMTEVKEKKSKKEEEYTVDAIVARRGAQCLVVWEGWSVLQSTWEQWSGMKEGPAGEHFALKDDLVKELVANGQWSDMNKPMVLPDWKSALQDEDDYEWKYRQLKWEVSLTDACRSHGAAPLFVVNLFDRDPAKLPHFQYSVKNVPSKGTEAELSRLGRVGLGLSCDGCSASGRCGGDGCCGKNMDATAVYREGLLKALPGKRRGDNAKEVYECTSLCGCSLSSCGNRVAQKPRRIPLAIVRDPRKGWCLRSASKKVIRKGTFVCEYVGQVLCAGEFEKTSVTYQLSMPYSYKDGGKEDDVFVLDARRVGNEARFISNMCDHPNLELVRVFADEYGYSYCRMAFFALRDIRFGDELGFTYNNNPDDRAKEGHGHRCLCRPDCKTIL